MTSRNWTTDCEKWRQKWEFSETANSIIQNTFQSILYSFPLWNKATTVRAQFCLHENVQLSASPPPVCMTWQVTTRWTLCWPALPRFQPAALQPGPVVGNQQVNNSCFHPVLGKQAVTCDRHCKNTETRPISNLVNRLDSKQDALMI